MFKCQNRNTTGGSSVVAGRSRSDAGGCICALTAQLQWVELNSAQCQEPENVSGVCGVGVLPAVPANVKVLCLERGVRPKLGLGGQSRSWLGSSRSKPSLTVPNFCLNSGKSLAHWDGYSCHLFPVPLCTGLKWKWHVTNDTPSVPKCR